MTESAASEPTTTYPPRFWWLKRLSTLGLCLLVGVLALRLIWGLVTARRLAVAEAAVAARGGWLKAEDLNPTVALPAKENAAWYFSRAAAALKAGVDCPASSSLECQSFPPFPPQWHQLADGSWAANQPSFALARAARPHQTADWGIRFTTPLTAAAIPPLTPARELANHLGDAALRSHVHGNDAAALEFIRDTRHLAYSLDRQPSLICHLVALGVEALALYRLAVITPGLEVSAGADIASGVSARDGPATRGQVEALIRELLDDPHPGKATAAALDFERIYYRDALAQATGGNWVIQPATSAREARLLEETARVGRAATQAGFPAARTLAPEQFDPNPAADDDPIAQWFGPFDRMYGRVITLDLRQLAERRLVAVSLAARLFYLDERRWPPSLDELTPRYLPSVPRDPFRADGGPLSYLIAPGPPPRHAPRPIVYHVSTDGFDETPAALAADASILPDEPQYSWHATRTAAAGGVESLDQWRDLSRFVPPPPPREGDDQMEFAEETGEESSGGDDDDSYQADDPGQDE